MRYVRKPTVDEIKEIRQVERCSLAEAGKVAHRKALEQKIDDMLYKGPVARIDIVLFLSDLVYMLTNDMI